MSPSSSTPRGEDVLSSVLRESSQATAEGEIPYRALLEHAAALIYVEVTDESRVSGSRATYISPHSIELLGYTPDELITDPTLWDDIVHPDDWEELFAVTNAVRLNERPFEHEYRVVRKDGEVRWVRDHASLVEDPATGVRHWQGLMLDITEQRRAQRRLSEAESRYRTLVEQLPLVTYLELEDDTDPDLAVYVSPQIEQLTGYTPAEWNADPGLWDRILHPDDRERVIAEDDLSRSTGQPMLIEYRFIARDGRVVWVRDEAVLLRDDEGEPLVWHGLYQDITRRKEAEEQLHQAEETFRTLVETIPAITYIDVASDTNKSPTLYISPQVQPILGYSPEEWMADPQLWMSSLHPDDCERVLEEDRASSFGATTRLSLEYRLIARDGHVVWIQDESVIVADENGVPRFEQGVMLDITARKEAEQAVTEAEAKYRALVEQIPAIVYIGEVGEEGDWLYVSPQIERVLGYTVEEWLAHPHPMQSFTHPDDIASARAEEERAYGRGDMSHAEYRMRSKDGRWLWILDEAEPVLDEAGRVLFMQGVMYDITERKHAEEELARALERLREVDEMKNTFLQAVSHELRTPLTAILGLAVTLERDDVGLDKSEMRDLATRIVSNSRKLDRMVADLLDLDRLTRGIVEPKLSDTDVGALVRHLVGETDFLDGQRVTVEAEPVVLAVDASKVEHIVENLLTNAVRHTSPVSHIWVRVATEDGGAMIVVEDDGPGVPDDMKAVIFEAFQRGPEAAETPGTGIGLSLVARFAELHGGRAWVEDRTGGGASFRIFLPGDDVAS